MLKSGATIWDLLFFRTPPKNRLSISPILEPRIQISSRNASVDLRLGCTFIVPNRAQLICLDPHDKQYEENKIRYMDKVYVHIGDYFVLHPRQFALGITLEWIHMPPDLGAYVVGRSGWGREGLIIATAAGVHPGYLGNLTLELTNLGEIPIKLYPGLRYAQLFLHDVSTKAVRRTKVAGEDNISPGSTFLGSTEPKSGRISLTEKEIIEGFKAQGRRGGSN
jgi:dCTP deaminase